MPDNRVSGEKAENFEMEEHSMKKRGYLLVTLLAILIMGLAMNVEAAEIIDHGYCGGEGNGKNLTWTLDSDGVLVIEGQGEMKDWIWDECDPESLEFELMDWHKHYGDINSVIIKEGITNMGDMAFMYCFSLRNIDLPESLNSIGEYAFYSCESLSSIVIPESLISIGDCAFFGCKNLISINLPESLIKIGDNVFGYCRSLGSIVWPKSLHSIGDYVFHSCENLSSIELPKTLTSIGRGAFRCCYSLSSIYLPESLTSIGDYAFEYCDSLRNIALPEKLTCIGEGVFCYCSSLSSINIPVSVDTIYRENFAASQLKDIYYGGTKEQWNNINIISRDVIITGYDGLSNATIHYVDDDNGSEKLNDFVTRLYWNFLKREPDERGLADWIDALVSGRGTGAKVVAGFVLSPEYKANSLNDEEYVTALYRIIFDREPDEGGLYGWISVLDNGCTYKKILEGFINSVEFDNLCKDLGIERGSYESDEIADKNYLVASFVARLYRLCLGRRYERKGLDNWVRALVYRTATGSSVVKDFFFSQEFLNRNLSDEEFVTVAYLAILGRKPDSHGFREWLDAMVIIYPPISRKQIIDKFLKSKEFGELCKQYGIVR